MFYLYGKKIDREDIRLLIENDYVLERNTPNIVRILFSCFRNNFKCLGSLDRMVTLELLNIMESCKDLLECSELVSLWRPFFLITSDSGDHVKPYQLFQPTDELRALFYGEPNRFPEKIFNNISTLLLFGLKTISEVTEEELRHCMQMVVGLNEAGDLLLMISFPK